MICLGIESTAHTLGIGIVNDRGNVLANEKASYTTEKGGIFPREAKAHHLLFYEFVLQRALEKAKIRLDDIDLISFSQGPGLGPCLRVGAVAARALATILNKPLVGVNHCVAHIEIGKQSTGLNDPATLYTSGANTQILAFAGGRYRVFGETLDTGVGNFLDSLGRILSIGFPAGPEIDKLASEGKTYIALPYTIKGMDFSFSGILTKLKQLAKSKKYSKEDLCYSTLHTVFAILTEATERAVAHLDKKEVLLTGGVAASKPLQEMLKTMCDARNIQFAVVPADLARDNGAMIAWQGILEYKTGKKPNIKDTEIKQSWRTDEVNVRW